WVLAIFIRRKLSPNWLSSGVCNPSMKEELLSAFGSQFEAPLVEEILREGQHVHVLEGQTLIEIGQYIRSIPLVMQGAVKVLREDDQGDELLLYYLEAGETCSATMACCMGQTQSEIRA